MLEIQDKRLSRIAEEVLSNALLIESLSNGQEELVSHALDGSDQSYQNRESFENACNRLREAAKTLLSCTIGPEQLLIERVGTGHHVSLAIQMMLEWDLPAHVPLRGQISFGDLATASGLHEGTLRRLVRLLITLDFFHESRDSSISHSNLSRLLAVDKQAKAFARHCLFDSFPASIYHVGAFAASGQHLSAQNCAFARREGQSFWQTLKAHPQRLAVFQEGQEFIARSSKSGSVAESFRGFDWHSLAPECTIVDIGGGNGQASIALAQILSSAKCICQDLPDVVACQASTRALEGRVEWQAHDYFESQPVKGAEVYLLRHVLHDWDDDGCRKILRAILPAMVTGSRLIICDFVVQEPGTVGRDAEQMIRIIDQNMSVLFGSKERALEDWTALVETECSTRLKFECKGSMLLSFICVEDK